MTPEPPDLPPSVSATEALAADAAGAHATDADAHAHSAGNTHCLNCGTKLNGPFCSACGQHDFDFHRSFRHVFLEALEGIFHFDGKFFRNLLTLLFRPGRLTTEFNLGKRASQVPPFRLYIFTAFVFFLLMFTGSDKRPPAVNIGPGSGAGVTVDGQPASLKDAIKELKDETRADNLRDDAPPPEVDKAKRAVEQPQEAADRMQSDAKKKLEERNRQKLREAKNRPAAEKNSIERWAESQGERAMNPEFQREMGHQFIAAIPKMLLFCLPVFALFTRVLFRKSGQVYLQHLVLALHFHTFIFVWVMFRDGWAFLAGLVGLDWIRGALLFAGNTWITIYPLLMLRNLFGNSWPKTIIKTLILALGYCLFLAVAFAATAVVLFLMM